MSLPKLSLPTYELTLSTTGKKVKYHPYTVPEKKLLLLVNEQSELPDIVESVKQVVKSCVVEPKDFDVNNSPLVDLELIFVNLRARSSGEIQEISFGCENIVDGQVCGGITSVPFNLLEAKVEKGEGHTNKIQINDKFGVVLKYPTFNVSQSLLKENMTESDALDIIVDSIDYIYTEDKVYYAKDHKREELVEWFNDIQESELMKIKEFFDTGPKLVGSSHFKCSKCGHEEDVKLVGLQDFFA